MKIEANIPVSVSIDRQTFPLARSEPQAIDVGMDVEVRTGSAEYYDGPYTVTPTTEEQTLSTSGKMMGGDVVVEPIPSNYGLITWNGATLRVS